MKNYILAFIILGLFLGSYFSVKAQDDDFVDFYDFFDQFQSSSDEQALINSYISWQASKGFPAIVNNTHAVFIYYVATGTVNSVAVAGDHNSWNPLVGPMKRLDSSYNFFYFNINFESDARIDYKFVVGGNWILDPRNPSQVSGGFGPNSELAMPDFVQPPEIEYRIGIAHGTLVERPTSFTTANPRLQIYLPPNYNTSLKYKTVYFTDGTEYLELASAVNIIDGMIADNRIQPIIGVFVDPSGFRHEWYDCSDANNSYLNYIDELVSFIDQNYSTNDTAVGRLHIGDSLGGQISLHVGIQRSNLFNNIGSHSGAFWDGPSSLGPIGCQIKEQFTAANQSLDLKMWFSAGKYESSILEDTKLVVANANEKCWRNEVIYLNEGHSWGSWRHTLDNALEFIFPFNNTQERPVCEEETTSTPTGSDIETTANRTISSGNTEESNLNFLSIFVSIPLISFIYRKFRKRFNLGIYSL